MTVLDSERMTLFFFLRDSIHPQTAKKKKVKKIKLRKTSERNTN